MYDYNLNSLLRKIFNNFSEIYNFNSLEAYK